VPLDLHFEVDRQSNSPAPSHTVRLFIIFLMFAAAFAVRMYHIKAPPFDFHPTRQYHSALLARWFFFKNSPSIPPWQKKVARLNRTSIIEPPFIELIASAAYRIAGAEKLWIPRVFSIVYWMIGGVFLYLIAQKLFPGSVALFSLGFYMFMPYAISASRSFQPEPLMIMVFLAGLWMILQYYHQPSIKRLLIAAAISGLAVLVKPNAVFTVFGAFIALGLFRHGFKGFILDGKSWLFLFVSVLPGGAYYLHGLFIGSALGGQPSMQFAPKLLLCGSFWSGWLLILGRVVGYVPFVAALVGLIIMPKGLPKALLAGLWISFFLMGLLFTKAIHTHDYYHLLFVPGFVISFSYMIIFLTRRFCSLNIRLRRPLFIVGIVLLTLFIGITVSLCQVPWRKNDSPNKPKLGFVGKVFIGHPYIKKIIFPPIERVRVSQKVGELLNHSTNTVFLARTFGAPLRYHGQIAGSWWFDQSFRRYLEARGKKPPDVVQYFDRMYDKQAPDYFIVTDLKELERQPQLKEILTSRFPVLSQSNDYVIFDLRKKDNTI